MFIIILTACSSEPMIQLSKENQAKLQEKMTSHEATSTVEEASDPMSDPKSLLDSNSWTLADQDQVFDLKDFIPYQANQLKTYHTGLKEYVEYEDDNKQVLQVRQEQAGSLTNVLYRWNDQEVERYAQLIPSQPLTNYLLEPIEGNQLDQAQVVLQAPLQVGQVWQRDAHSQSQIVALYDQIHLGDQTYQEAIEVVSQEEEGDLHEVYVAHLGLVASWRDQDQPILLLEASKDSVMYVYQASTYLPLTSDPTNGPLLEAKKAARTWQTNDHLAQAFQRLFQEQGWIGPDIQVLDISLKDQNTAAVSFSPGVVATFSQHPAGEYGVIAAIVQNIADHFQVDKVQVLVQGNWMITATFPAPPASIYQVDPTWIQSKDSLQEEVTMTSQELVLEP